jgi:hypothetical protein
LALTGAEGGRAALAPDPDGTHGREPAEADGAVAVASLHLLF